MCAAAAGALYAVEFIRPRAFDFSSAGACAHLRPRLPKDLLDRAKREAAAEGRTLTSLIEDGLRLMVADGRKAAKGKRVLPPISKASGGPIPGIGLTEVSPLQEIEDLDYVGRTKRFK